LLRSSLARTEAIIIQGQGRLARHLWRAGDYTEFPLCLPTGQVRSKTDESGYRPVGLSVYRPFEQRAYWLVNPALVGQTIGKFCQQFPEYQIENVDRGDQLLGADPGLLLELDALTKHMVLDPEVLDARALNIALDEAVILVTHQCRSKGLYLEQIAAWR